MEPAQHSSSSSTPFSDEETKLFYSIRDSMDETFSFANAEGKLALWVEVSRRSFGAFGHERSPQELEARFGKYKPKRLRKKRKRATAQAEAGSSALLQEQERLARCRAAEAARKRLLEQIDLNAFFSEGNSWRGAVISLRLGRSESELGEWRRRRMSSSSVLLPGQLGSVLRASRSIERKNN